MKRLFASVVAVVMLSAALPAVAASFTVKNCTGERLMVQSYNSNDPIFFIAHSENTGDPGASVLATCATTTCKLHITYYNTSAGPVVKVLHVEAAHQYQSDRCTRSYTDQPLLPLAYCNC